MKHILLIALLLFALLPSKADWNLVPTNNPNLVPTNNPNLISANNPNNTSANNPNLLPANNPNIVATKNTDNILTITPAVETVFYAVSNYNIANQYINHAPAVRLKK